MLYRETKKNYQLDLNSKKRNQRFPSIGDRTLGLYEINFGRKSTDKNTEQKHRLRKYRAEIIIVRYLTTNLTKFSRSLNKILKRLLEIKNTV